jgi:hypothetical protein
MLSSHSSFCLSTYGKPLAFGSNFFSRSDVVSNLNDHGIGFQDEAAAHLPFPNVVKFETILTRIGQARDKTMRKIWYNQAKYLDVSYSTRLPGRPRYLCCTST